MNIKYHTNTLKHLSWELRKSQFLLFIGLLTSPLIIGIFLAKSAISGIRNSKEGIAECIQSIETSTMDEFNRLNARIDSLIRSDTYVTTREIIEFKTKLNDLLESFNSLGDRLLKKNTSLLRIQERLISSIDNVENQLNASRIDLIERHSKEYEFIFEAGDFPLDADQRAAIITDDHENLVVAGAGSGKTEVLITRIAYIIKRLGNNSPPERILALAYTRKSRDEMRARLKQRFDVDVDIRTFHSLGMEILKQNRRINGGTQFKVFSDDQTNKKRKEIVQRLFMELSMDKEFSRKITNFISLQPCKDKAKGKDDFEEDEEYIRYMSNLRYHALDGTEVRSLSERRILNFLLTHSINGKKIDVKYEEPAAWMDYEVDGISRTPNPDFFLPDYGLYIEHWAVDREGNVPEWFDGENPSELYRNGMEMKRDKFNQQDLYYLIETFEFEAREQDIEDVLEQKLFSFLQEHEPEIQHRISPLPYDYVRKMIIGGRNDNNESLENLVLSFSIKAKANFQSTDEIRNRLKEPNWNRRQKSFGQIALDILDAYNNELWKQDTIDFDDMIVLATQMLNENPNLMKDVFDHILIDEYQDISPLRFQLISTLLHKNDRCHLFCVGDDWQSIMGFSGSDISYFLDFKGLFPLATISFLETNYRSNSSIVDAGASSILHNNNQIIKKTESSFLTNDVNIKVIVVDQKGGSANHNINKKVISMVASLLRNGYLTDEIMILSRVVNCRRIKDLVIQANDAGVPISDESKHYGQVPIMSIHKSKGLQARTVIILDATESEHGLPSTKRTSDLLGPAIRTDIDPIEEERRLFYVALTRAKDKVLIYVDSDSPRPFIDEISDKVELIPT